MTKRAIPLSLCVAALGVACGSNPPRAPRTFVEARPTATGPDFQLPPPDEATASNVTISADIRSACGISDIDAFFAYDSANVRAQDRAILKKLADCFSTGPLKGREMRLVGHADPRGDEEYNRVLGQRRADNVKSAVVEAGMTAGSIATTSRGEDDASGVEEAGWARDRRVDIVLGS
jgi:peptidoglycan-associated lipoprotein